MTIVIYTMVKLRQFVIVSKNLAIGGNPYSYFLMVSNLTLVEKVSKLNVLELYHKEKRVLKVTVVKFGTERGEENDSIWLLPYQYQ